MCLCPNALQFNSTDAVLVTQKVSWTYGATTSFKWVSAWISCCSCSRTASIPSSIRDSCVFPYQHPSVPLSLWLVLDWAKLLKARKCLGVQNEVVGRRLTMRCAASQRKTQHLLQWLSFPHRKMFCVWCKVRKGDSHNYSHLCSLGGSHISL